MEKPWNIGVILLELLGAAMMLLFLLYGLSQLETIQFNTRNNMQSAAFQREYASLQRFQGTGIAYTEVLNAIYIQASNTLPVAVVSEGWFQNHLVGGVIDHDDVDNPFRFPFSLNNFGEALEDRTVPANMTIFPEPLVERAPVGNIRRSSLGYGIWTGASPIIVGGVPQGSQFRAISDFLTGVSRHQQNPNAFTELGLTFTGRILRNQSGTPYLIVFTYVHIP